MIPIIELHCFFTGERVNGYDALFNEVVLEKIQLVMDENDTVRIRVYQVSNHSFHQYSFYQTHWSTNLQDSG